MVVLIALHELLAMVGSVLLLMVMLVLMGLEMLLPVVAAVAAVAVAAAAAAVAAVAAVATVAAMAAVAVVNLPPELASVARALYGLQTYGHGGVPLAPSIKWIAWIATHQCASQPIKTHAGPGWEKDQVTPWRQRTLSIRV